MYQNLAGALAGTQEYMAMEKLYELHRERRYDIVVVDTPPTRNALDLLDAPGRLTRFLENRLFRPCSRRPGSRCGRSPSPRGRCSAPSPRWSAAEIVQDAVAFFQAFEGMEEGFRTRARAVRSCCPIRPPPTCW